MFSIAAEMSTISLAEHEFSLFPLDIPPYCYFRSKATSRSDAHWVVESGNPETRSGNWNFHPKWSRSTDSLAESPTVTEDRWKNFDITEGLSSGRLHRKITARSSTSVKIDNFLFSR
jgi:hypothetical protein